VSFLLLCSESMSSIDGSSRHQDSVRVDHARDRRMSVRIRAEPAEVPSAERRNGHAGRELLELPGSAREGHRAGEGVKVERDVTVGGVRTTRVENEVAVEYAGTEIGGTRVDDLRADRDRVEVRRGDRAELTGAAMLPVAILRHVENPSSRCRCQGRYSEDKGERDCREHREPHAAHSRTALHAEPPSCL
jgi:hypothetical protein